MHRGRATQWNQKIKRNTIELKITNINENAKQFIVTYPEEYEEIICKLNPYFYEKLNFRGEKNNLIHLNGLYSYDLKQSLIYQSIVLINQNKIAQFEFKVLELLRFIIAFYKIIPKSHLNDFYVCDHDSFKQLFGMINYFIDLTSVEKIKFFSQQFEDENDIENHIEIGNVIEIMEEIREIVGTSEQYHLFDEFIERMKLYTSIEEIRNDPFYEHCYKRIEILLIDRNHISVGDKFQRGSISELRIGKMNEEDEEVCLITFENNGNDFDGFNKSCLAHYSLYDHKFIVPISGIVKNDDENENYIVIKMLKETLKDYFETELKILNNEYSIFELHPSTTLLMILDILTIGLSFKQNNILYRDYKPMNFTLTKNNRIKLYNLVSLVLDHPDNVGLFGTPMYSPEDFRDETDFFRSEVYSLGLTLMLFFIPQTMKEISVGIYRYEDVPQIIPIILNSFNEKLENIENSEQKRYMEMIFPILEHTLKNNHDERAFFDELYVMRKLTIQFLRETYGIEYEFIDMVFEIEPFLDSIANQYPSLKPLIDEMKQDSDDLGKKIENVIRELFRMAMEETEKRKEILYQVRVIVSMGLIRKDIFDILLNEIERMKKIYYSI